MSQTLGVRAVYGWFLPEGYPDLEKAQEEGHGESGEILLEAVDPVVGGKGYVLYVPALTVTVLAQDQDGFTIAHPALDLTELVGRGSGDVVNAFLDLRRFARRCFPNLAASGRDPSWILVTDCG